MMHMIKFRAWIPAEKKMVQVDGLSLLNGYVTSEWAQQTWSIRDVELMQFTGLTDKNGKDIYDGDIVKSVHWWEEPHEFIWPDDIYWVIECSLSDRLEVIGNIYENPELLP